MRSLTYFLLFAFALVSGDGWAESKTEVKITDEYRLDSYPLGQVRTVAIFTVRAAIVKSEAGGMSGWRWAPDIILPNDTSRFELSRELAKSIKRRDSAVTVHILRCPDSLYPDSSLVAQARDSLQADAVILVTAQESRVEKAGLSPSLEGVMDMATGGRDDIWRWHTARSQASVRFELYDTNRGALVWAVTCKTKFQPDRDSPINYSDATPPPAVAAAYVAAMSKLPF